MRCAVRLRGANITCVGKIYFTQFTYTCTKLNSQEAGESQGSPVSSPRSLETEDAATYECITSRRLHGRKH